MDDWMRCRNSADEYYYLYWLLRVVDIREKARGKKQKFPQLEIPDIDVNMMASNKINITKIQEPINVIAAFACELYLKSYLQKINNGKKNIRSHKIKDLFTKLPEDIQIRCIEYYNTYLIKRNKISIECNKEKRYFESQITLIDDAFVKWRYPHEFTNPESYLTDGNDALIVALWNICHRDLG